MHSILLTYNTPFQHQDPLPCIIDPDDNTGVYRRQHLSTSEYIGEGFAVKSDSFTWITWNAHTDNEESVRVKLWVASLGTAFYMGKRRKPLKVL